MKQPSGCFNPAGFAAAPLRIKMLTHFVEQQSSSSSRKPKKQKGPIKGPFSFWRAMCRMHECRGGHGWPGAAPERLLETAQWLFQPCGLRGCAAPDQNAGAFCRTAALIFIQTPKKQKGPIKGPFSFWRAMCRMHECRGGHGWPGVAPGDYLKQPSGCFNPAGFAAAPLRIKMLTHFVEQQSSSSSRTPKKQKGPVKGPFSFWRARRDSNSRPLGS